MSGYSFFAVRVFIASEPLVVGRSMYEPVPCTIPGHLAAFCPTVSMTITSITMTFYARVLGPSTVTTLSFLTPWRKRKRMFTWRRLKEKEKKKRERKKPSVMGDRTHVMAFSDLFALWVIRIKDWVFPHVVCRDHVTSSTKCRSHSESTLKVCFFSSQNNKIWWLAKRWRHIFWEMNRCAKVCGLLFMIVIFGCWLAGQENCNHVDYIKQCF